MVWPAVHETGSNSLTNAAARSDRRLGLPPNSRASFSIRYIRGKGAAGLIDYCRKGKLKKGERVVFLHAGGSAAHFGYNAAFSEGQAALAAE